jgi:ABC-type cobalamin/Fe3+-siderophores transport system ATPase subunit
MDYVEEFELNEYSGALHLTVRFSEGLNIIGGENGTGKTTLIRRLRESINGGPTKIHRDDPSRPNVIRVFALSPKRNAERQAYEQIVARLRQQNRTYATLVSELTNRAINDATFEAYPHLGEAFYFHYENATRDGGSQIEGMNLVVQEFNSVLQKVFPNYRIMATWDAGSRSPVPMVQVDNREGLRLDALSLGQREVLSLMFNIYTARNDYDLVLIDEPELHLNWTLERGLFEFFDWFCSEYKKQMIVTTHSRVAFDKSFLPRTQFLVWNGNSVECTQTPSNTQRVAMAGEIAASIVAAAPQLTTFYVEDDRQSQVVSALAKARGRAVTTVPCGSSEVVKAIFKFARGQAGWDQNAFFVIDGDNQGNSFPGQTHFVHLDRYCVECYLLDMRVLQHMTGKAEAILQQDLLAAVKGRSAAIFKTGKSGAFGQRLLSRARVEDLTTELLAELDCSEILDEFARLEAVPADLYIRRYVASAGALGIAEEVFDTRLLMAVDLGQLETAAT